jgi:hypothetical protein
VPCDRGHSSCGQKEESGWRHACGHRLRTFFHHAAASLGSPPPMLSSCTCIAVPLSRRSLMKIRRSTRIAGAATRPGDRKPGSAWLNGSGTSGWSWAINCIPIRYARSLVCACSPASPTSHSPVLRLCSSGGGLSMEGWSFLGQRFHAPTRRDASLSSKPAAPCSGAAPRSRWEPTRGVCRQHSQLPSLSAARAMSMEWQCYGEAAPGQRSPASPQRRGRAAPLARLESKSSLTCVHPTPASPTGGGTKGTGHHSQSRRPVFASFQSIPGALSALLGRAPGT